MSPTLVILSGDDRRRLQIRKKLLSNPEIMGALPLVGIVTSIAKAGGSVFGLVQGFKSLRSKGGTDQRGVYIEQSSNILAQQMIAEQQFKRNVTILALTALGGLTIYFVMK